MSNELSDTQKEKTGPARWEWMTLGFMVLCFVVAIANLFGLTVVLEHQWRKIGPDSDTYVACWEQVMVLASTYEMREVEKSGSGDDVVFRWEGSVMTPDNSPAYSPTFECSVTAEGPVVTADGLY